MIRVEKRYLSRSLLFVAFAEAFLGCSGAPRPSPRAATSTDAGADVGFSAWPSPHGISSLATRLCVEADGNVVVENECGCNDALLCTATLESASVTVHVGKDPARLPMCDDCSPMVPGRCPLPPAATGRVWVHAGDFGLFVDVVGGKPRDATRSCVTRARE